jgi:hypothetical protein
VIVNSYILRDIAVESNTNDSSRALWQQPSVIDRPLTEDTRPRYRQHINMKDNLVFPLAARLLSPTDRTAIAAEMAARRNLRVVRVTNDGPDSSCEDK